MFKRVQAGEDDLGIAGRGSGGGVDGELESRSVKIAALNADDDWSNSKLYCTVEVSLSKRR